MPLDAAQLDTLNWDEIMTGIRTRIVPDSRGKWTLHAPVDPGITLLELFAWLLDQRIYWMDQLPDALIQSVLAFLGEKPNPAQAAITLLQLKDDSNQPVRTVARGTAMRLADSDLPVIFTLDQDMTILALDEKKIAVTVNGLDRSSDLAQQRPMSLIGAGSDSAEIQISFPLVGPIGANVSGNLSVMLELENPDDVQAQWSPAAVDNVPPPATLTIAYGNASTTPVAADDGTAGLRRSGVIRVPLSGWKPDSGSTYSVLLSVRKAAYTAPPVLLRVVPNVVLAHHRWPQTKHPVTKTWLPLPGNVISLSDTPGGSTYHQLPPIENSVAVQVTERDNELYSWNVVPSFSFAGPSDRVCVVDRTRGEIRFGDGLTGRLPVLAGKVDSEIQVSYLAGGGPGGNLGTNLEWEAIKEDLNAPDPMLSAVNVVEAAGGKESETLTAARQRAQARINERNRAVTQADYQNLVQSTPGVAFRRAYAAIGYHPDFPCSTVQGAVTVFVVPYAPRESVSKSFIGAPQPDPGALQAALNRLDQGRLLGTQVFVRGAVYRPVCLDVQIATDSNLSSHVRQQIVTTLRNYLDPLSGGDNASGWPFGAPLRPSDLSKQAQAVLGKSGDVLSVAVCLDGQKTPESCKDVPILPHELLKVEKVDLHVQRRAVQRGGLR